MSARYDSVQGGGGGDDDKSRYNKTLKYTTTNFIDLGNLPGTNKAMSHVPGEHIDQSSQFRNISDGRDKSSIPQFPLPTYPGIQGNMYGDETVEETIRGVTTISKSKSCKKVDIEIYKRHFPIFEQGYAPDPFSSVGNEFPRAGISTRDDYNIQF